MRGDARVCGMVRGDYRSRRSIAAVISVRYVRAEPSGCPRIERGTAVISAVECSLYAFYDTNQGVFNSPDGWHPPFAADPIRLETNLRNTKPVGELVTRLGQMDGAPRYAVAEGPRPEIIAYATVAGMTQQVMRIIGELTGRGRVGPDDIVVLAPYRHDSVQVGFGDLIRQNRSLFTTEMSSPSGKIRVGTIQAFKGLEADAVILCGIDGKLRACKPANLYVGASRARSMLFLLHERGC